MKKGNSLFFVIGVSCLNFAVKAQNIAINTTGVPANSSSMLDITAGSLSNKGLLIPRVTFAQKMVNLI